MEINSSNTKCLCKDININFNYLLNNLRATKLDKILFTHEISYFDKNHLILIKIIYFLSLIRKLNFISHLHLIYKQMIIYKLYIKSIIFPPVLSILICLLIWSLINQTVVDTCL